MSIKVDETWRRISGCHIEDDGSIGVVWIARDPLSDITVLYDAVVFRDQEFPVIADGINARGKWIPMAWPKGTEHFTEKLRKEYGINTLIDPCEDKQSAAEMITKTVSQRMKTGRFIPSSTAGAWLQERKSYSTHDQKVPLEGFPLMSATRHAVEMLSWAKPQVSPKGKQANYPKVPLV